VSAEKRRFTITPRLTQSKWIVSGDQPLVNGRNANVFESMEENLSHALSEISLTGSIPQADEFPNGVAYSRPYNTAMCY
jgi:hypothetical protein